MRHRFRSGKQSFLYCYRNLAKWLGVPYFAWRNTDTGSEEQELQNLKVNIEQFGHVMTAALAAATSKAQARYLGSRAGTEQELEIRTRELQSAERSIEKFHVNLDAAHEHHMPALKASRSPSWPSIFNAAVKAVFVFILLVLLTILAVSLQKYCRCSCRRMSAALFGLLCVAVTVQIIVIDAHQLQKPKLTANKLNPPEPGAGTATDPSNVMHTNSLYAQFLRRYTAATGTRFPSACPVPVQQPRIISPILIFGFAGQSAQVLDKVWTVDDRWGRGVAAMR